MSFTAQDETVAICPICEKEQLIETGQQVERLKIKNESIQITAVVERCTACDEIFTTTDEEEKNIQKAYRQYRRKAKLLQPEEIKAIRKKYGLSQKSFACLMGWGEITLHRYESGALQDEVHNDLLLLLEKSENFSTIFEKNKHRLIPKQVQKVQKILSKLLESTMVTMTTLATPMLPTSKWQDLDNFRKTVFQQETNKAKTINIEEMENTPALALVA